MTFPNGWPEGCPPYEAVDASDDIFRIVGHEPPADCDFMTHFESGKLPNAPPCLRCGLSVFRQIGDAIHQRRLLPRLGRLIAKGTLSAEHGKTKVTPGKQPTHTTWWPYERVNRASLFSVVSEEV
jgi:hypothetical protein